jgi:sphingomyelin phosphodiesterase 2
MHPYPFNSPADQPTLAQIKENMAPGDGDDDAKWTEIRVLTLNCWGLYAVSKKRRERMAAIGAFLSRGEYDVVVLQEVWCNEDFVTIKNLVMDAFPHSHFFDNGVIGSGTCVFSRVQIHDATFHEFTMNGYPHKIWHGDWFGGKGLGVCQLLFKGFDVHVYTSHYHAEYDRKHDVYLGHRVLHALESAEWIRLSSSSADLTIYAGDFNTEPTDVPYQMLRTIAHLSDSWEDAHGENDESPESKTCGAPTNSFALPSDEGGKRIDYVLHKPGPNVKSEVVHCQLPLPSRVPGKEFSYSDHEAVAATIRIRRDDESPRRIPDLKR